MTDPPDGPESDSEEGLMTPPQVLLTECLDRSRELSKSKHQSVAVESWVRCTALARIVHGDTHWMLGLTHTQLAQQYLHEGLNEQALSHATRGLDILLHSTSHVTTEATPPDAAYSLALAHCVIGLVQTAQKKSQDAHRSLLKAEKVTTRYQQLAKCEGVSDVQLRLDIVTGLGRVCLDEDDITQAKAFFQKAQDLCMETLGDQSCCLVSILRGLASAALREDGGGEVAITTLREALTLAETNYGCESEEVGDCLLGLGRANAVSGGASGTVEDYLHRAHTVYSKTLGQQHNKTVSCKDELCKYLSTQSGSRQKLITMLKEIIAEKKLTFGTNSTQVAESLKLLGTVQLTQGDVQSAVKSLTKAKAVFSTATALGPKHPEVQSISETLDIIVGRAERKTAKPIFKTTV